MTTNRINAAALLVALQGFLMLAFTYAGVAKVGLIETDDSRGYRLLASATVPEVLSSARTIGYPLVLRAVQSVSDDLAILPLVHVSMNTLAAACLAWFLSERTREYTAAVLVGTTVLWSNVALGFAARVMTDALGLSFAVLAMASLVGLGTRPTSRFRWILYALAVAAAYQTRPIYQFLIGVGPVIAIWLLPTTLGRRALVRFVLGVAGASLLPMLLFVLVRGSVTGHYGTTSFLGTNLIGIAGQNISAAEAQVELDEPLRSITTQAIGERDRAWTTYPWWDLTIERQVLDRTTWNERYYTTHIAFVRAVSDHLAREGVVRSEFDRVATDQLLRQISFALIRKHPRRYAYFVLRELAVAARRLLVGQPLVLPIALLTIAVMLKRSSPFWQEGDPGNFPSANETAKLVLPIGALFAVGKVIPVCLLEPAIDRYIDAAGVFVPGLAAVLALSVLGSVSLVKNQ